MPLTAIFSIKPLDFEPVWSAFRMIGSATGHKGSNVREVPADVFIARLSKHLETSRLVEAPKWADLCKTGCLKQMPPNFQNWWYIRAAAVARQVYLHPGTSVEELKNRFGSKKHYGTAPCHFCQSSGKVVRVILQQLEKLGWVKKADEGRNITAKGQRQLDLIAQEVKKSLQ